MKRFLTILTLIPILLSFSSIEVGAYGIDPKLDSLQMKQFQARMDSIRQHRPVVALVLSGGGAKGCAHIGALRRIEEVGIPIDMVLGTSMGGLVGGMLSLGYSPDDMEKTVTEADWGYLITDKMPREYKSLREIKYKGQHQLTIPFFYEKEEYAKRKEEAWEEEGHQHKYGNIFLGAKDEKVTARDNLWESLPESFVPGQNVTNLINGLTVGYSDTLDFINLPIPFCSTASDMVSCQPKRWYSGKMSRALRSTMSIPILFASVRTEGMVLVDGGMRDNYPVELARELGADLVIGVELSDASKTYSDINNLADILSQGIDMLGSDAFRRNQNAADLKIKPDLHEYNMLSFDDASIPIIIQRGYEAATAVDSLLFALKKTVGDDSLKFYARKATNLSVDYVHINEVEVTGVSEKEEQWLIDNAGIIPGGLVNRAKMERIVGDICATQTFENVTYELLGSEEPYKLVIHCTKGPIHQLGVGVRFDTEEIIAANINLGLGTRRLQGSRFELNAHVSSNPSVSAMYSYDSPQTPTFNVEVKAGYSNLGGLDFGDDPILSSSQRLDATFWKAKADFYISNIKWRQIDGRCGVRSEFFSANRVDAETYGKMYDMTQNRSDYFTAYLDASSETYDRYYFPTKGHSISLYYGWTFAGFGKQPGTETSIEFHDFHTVALNGRFIIPAGKVLTIIPQFDFRYVISAENIRNRKDDSFGSAVPVPFMNLVGGTLAGRYLDQQVPFIGLNYATGVDNLMMLGRVDFQFHLAKNHYLTAQLNYARDAHMFSKLGQGSNYVGAGFEYTYNSIIGPISANLHWGACDRGGIMLPLTKLPGLYVSAGYIF